MLFNFFLDLLFVRKVLLKIMTPTRLMEFEWTYIVCIMLALLVRSEPYEPIGSIANRFN